MRLGGGFQGSKLLFPLGGMEAGGWGSGKERQGGEEEFVPGEREGRQGGVEEFVLEGEGRQGGQRERREGKEIWKQGVKRERERERERERGWVQACLP